MTTSSGSLSKRVIARYPGKIYDSQRKTFMAVPPSKHTLNCCRKTLGGFRFVLSKLPHYDLVLKLDDDLDIRSRHRHRRHLHLHIHRHHLHHHCCCHHHHHRHHCLHSHRQALQYMIWGLPWKITTKAKFGPLGQNWDFWDHFMTFLGLLVTIFIEKATKLTKKQTDFIGCIVATLSAK